MINNNRQAGRRRGRNNNNPRQGGGGNNNRGSGDSGNRIDSRARGNAAQLLEKYRNMARDSQMSGDRVNTEYYLQFADHYFRVLADSRARQEEQNPHLRRQREEAEAAAAEEAEYDPSGFDDGFGNRPEFIARPEQNFRPERAGRQDQNYRQDRGERSEQVYRQDRQDGRENGRDERPERQDREMNGRQDRQRDDRPQRDDRFQRDDRSQREARPPRDDNRSGGYGRSQRDDRERPPFADRDQLPRVDQSFDRSEETETPSVEPAELSEAPKKRGRPRREAVAVPAEEGRLSLDAAILPPSIVQADNDQPEPPKRRGRPPRPAAEAAE